MNNPCGNLQRAVHPLMKCQVERGARCLRAVGRLLFLLSVNTNPVDNMPYRFLKIQDNQPKEKTTLCEAGTLEGQTQNVAKQNRRVEGEIKDKQEAAIWFFVFFLSFLCVIRGCRNKKLIGAPAALFGG